MNTAKMILTTLIVAGCLAIFTHEAHSQELPEWVKNLKISGDFGARTEYINDRKSTDNYDRVRERLRIRLSIDTTLVDKMKVSLGVETSGSNPTSAWTDFTDFRNQPLYVAHAYLQYEFSDKLTISGGKLKNDVPFWKPAQLVWKNDVNPFGVSANVGVKLGRNLDFFLNGGLFALTEYRDNEWGLDTPMNIIAVVQPGIEYRRGGLLTKGAVAVQQFSLVNHDISSNTWIRSNRSHTLITSAWDVSYPNLVGSYGPMFAGEYSKNMHENADSDSQAYLIQAGFGNEKIDRFKAWQVKAAYRRRELNAIPYGFGQTSAYDGEPGKGWEYFVALGLTGRLAFNATLYDMNNLDGALPQLVSQFDLVYRF